MCDRDVWSCSLPFLGTLYDAGYAIASIGNDSNTGPLPITSSVYTVTPAGTIATDEKHPITNGWTTTPNSLSDKRFSILTLSPKAFSIARDQTNNWSEVFYIEEPGKGRWIHYQSNGSPNTVLFDNANMFLLRDNIIGKGKNYQLYTYNNAVYGFLNNQKLSKQLPLTD
jgi:hypothetical protein